MLLGNCYITYYYTTIFVSNINPKLENYIENLLYFSWKFLAWYKRNIEKRTKSKYYYKTLYFHNTLKCNMS